jgi:LysR family transcriptional regulator, glycine cleavage system transcriptional activator
MKKIHTPVSDQFPFNALRAFEAVARNGSFTRAAEELHVTQSAISHQVKQLEQWLGGPIIHRKGSSQEVLPHGLLLSNVLATAFDDIQKACRRAKETAKPRSLVIAVIPSVATCWLIPKMSEFRNLYPNLSTRVIYAIHGHQIDFREVDVAIIYATGKLDINGTSSTKLLPGESAPVCNRSFLNLHGPLEEPHQIAAAGLLHDTDMMGWGQWFQKVLHRRFVPPDGPVFEDFNLLRAATLAGQGVSLCPLSIIHDDLQSDRLVQLSDVTVHSDSAYYLVEPDQANSARRPEEKLFRDWLEQVRNEQI